MARDIHLTQGQVAIVDDEDFDRISRHKWFAQWNPLGKRFYAVRNMRVEKNRQRPVFMHREVLRVSPTSRMRVDHRKSTESLNNTRGNLRRATPRQNACNTKLRSDNSSGFRGVVWHKCTEKWLAQINYQSKKQYLGLFDDKIEAARAYDRAAMKLHGEFATLNFPREEYQHG